MNPNALSPSMRPSRFPQKNLPTRFQQHPRDQKVQKAPIHRMRRSSIVQHQTSSLPPPTGPALTPKQENLVVPRCETEIFQKPGPPCRLLHGVVVQNVLIATKGLV